MPKGEERVGRGCARNPSLWVGGGGWGMEAFPDKRRLKKNITNLGNSNAKAEKGFY